MSGWIDTRAYYASEGWKKKSREAKGRAGWKCAICGDNWRQRKGGYLAANHTTYERLGNERQGDLNVLCDRHHIKGTFTHQQTKEWRTDYRLMGLLEWLLFLPFRMAGWLAMRALRGAKAVLTRRG